MENHSNEAGGGIVGFIVLYLIIAWFAHWWPFINYEKPWWDGSKSQKVCVVHNPNNSNCYTFNVEVDNGRIVEIEFPNLSTVEVVSMECGKAITFKGRYCDVTDSKSRDWQIEKAD